MNRTGAETLWDSGKFSEFPMQLKYVPVMVLALLPMQAQARVTGELVAQGSNATVTGIAHVQRRAEGTFIELDNPNAERSVAGFVSFGDEPSFPDLGVLDGRNVAITGVVVLDGRAIIVMTDPEQLRVAG
jgi:hypothetical protein